MSIRGMKKQVFELLGQENIAENLPEVTALPARRVINPLFGLLYNGNDRVRWHAITAMGAVTAQLAEQNMEAARIIMRRLMWNLNDESGGIGWGSPEAMGEIMACHERLAREYAAILISYMNPQGNCLEHEGLQQGLLWGYGRLAHARPSHALPGAPFLKPFLSSSSPNLRGLATWAAAAVIDSDLKKLTLQLRSDPAVITLYSERRLVQVSIADLAKPAMAREHEGR
jgi:hypothetical protein